MANSQVRLPAIDPIELLLASIGIRAIVSRQVERVTKGQLDQINTIPRQILMLSRDLVDGTKIEQPDYPKHNYRQTLEDLARGWDIDQVVEMVDQFPKELTVAGHALVVRSQEIIQAMLKDYPVSTYTTVAGSTNLAPSSTRMFKFISVLEVLDHPMCVFNLMQQGALLQSQTKAMRMVYPSLSEAIDAAIFDSTTRARAAKKSFELPYRSEVGVKAWFGRPPIPGPSLAKAQDIAKQSQAKKQAQNNPTQPQPQLGQVGNAAMTTGAQRATAGMA